MSVEKKLRQANIDGVLFVIYSLGNFCSAQKDKYTKTCGQTAIYLCPVRHLLYKKMYL